MVGNTMDWLHFVASIVGSLAWPLTVVILVVLLRGPITRVLFTLSRLKYKDLEVAFGQELRQLEEKAKAIDIIPRQSRSIPSTEKDSPQLLDEATRLAQDFPEGAVFVGWQVVENELMSAVMRLAISPDYPPYNSALKNAQLLKEENAIDEGTVELLSRMRTLRNMAMPPSSWHGYITTGEAIEFLALARGVVERLQAARRGRNDDVSNRKGTLPTGE
jgi:uncharacterized protein YutE (UPF0331/DUF86 family)